MAGQVCLAVATRADEVGAGGTIPLQGYGFYLLINIANDYSCEYLNMDRTFDDQSPYINQSLFSPEWIYGVVSPRLPAQPS